MLHTPGEFKGRRWLMQNELQRDDVDRLRRAGRHIDAIDIQMAFMMRSTRTFISDLLLFRFEAAWARLGHWRPLRRLAFNLSFLSRTLWALPSGRLVCSACLEPERHQYWCDCCGLLACAACSTTINGGYLHINDVETSTPHDLLTHPICAPCLYLALHQEVGWHYHQGQRLRPAAAPSGAPPPTQQPCATTFWAFYRAWCHLLEETRYITHLPWPWWYERVTTNFSLPDLEEAPTRERLPHPLA